MSFEREVPYNDLPSLPPSVELETHRVLKQTIATARALAELRGTASRIPNPRILINGLVLQEARLSSEIENILTTNDELYRAAASMDSPAEPNTKEVLRYREALWYGFEQIQQKPISTNLMVEIVRIIRRLEIGIRTVPGTALKTKTGEIIYTPPEGETLLRHKLADLERYLYSDDTIDPLIKLAVMHYQFEAIHPFSDGNGRTGRILNVLFLVERGLLDLPILYLSHSILRNKATYYTGLRQVTEEGRWEDWVLFMLKAIEETSQESSRIVNRLLEQIEITSAKVRLVSPGIYSKDLIEAVFSNPYCRIRFIEQATGVTRQTASTYLQRLTELEVLRPEKLGRELLYVNDEVLKILSSGIG